MTAISTNGIEESLLLEETRLRFDNKFEQYPRVIHYVIENKVRAILAGNQEGLHPGVLSPSEWEVERQRVDQLFDALSDEVVMAVEDIKKGRRQDLLVRTVLLFGRATVLYRELQDDTSIMLLVATTALLEDYFETIIEWQPVTSDVEGEPTLKVQISNDRYHETPETVEAEPPSVEEVSERNEKQKETLRVTIHNDHNTKKRKRSNTSTVEADQPPVEEAEVEQTPTGNTLAPPPTMSEVVEAEPENTETGPRCHNCQRRGHIRSECTNPRVRPPNSRKRKKKTAGSSSGDKAGPQGYANL